MTSWAYPWGFTYALRGPSLDIVTMSLLLAISVCQDRKSNKVKVNIFCLCPAWKFSQRPYLFTQNTLRGSWVTQHSISTYQLPGKVPTALLSFSYLCWSVCAWKVLVGMDQYLLLNFPKFVSHSQNIKDKQRGLREITMQFWLAPEMIEVPEQLDLSPQSRRNPIHLQ